MAAMTTHQPLLCDNTCSSCLSTSSIFDDHMIQCDGCQGWTHPSCYVTKDDPTAQDKDNDKKWFCSRCVNNSTTVTTSKACQLCSCSSQINAVARYDPRTNTSAHQCCIMYTGELDFNTMNGDYEAITSKNVDPMRKDLVCYICNGFGGAIMQCCRGGPSSLCDSKESYFHAICTSIEAHKNRNNGKFDVGPVTLIDFEEVQEGSDIFIDTIPIAYCAKHRNDVDNYKQDSRKILDGRERGRNQTQLLSPSSPSMAMDVDPVVGCDVQMAISSPIINRPIQQKPRMPKRQETQQEIERSKRLLQAFAKDAARQKSKTNAAIFRQQVAARLPQPKPMSPEVAQLAKEVINMSQVQRLMMPTSAMMMAAASAPKVVWDGHMQAVAKDEKNQEIINKLRKDLTKAQADLRTEQETGRIRLNLALKSQEAAIANKLKKDYEAQLHQQRQKQQQQHTPPATSDAVASMEKTIKQQATNNRILERALESANKRELAANDALSKLQAEMRSKSLRSRSRSRSRSRERDIKREQV